MHTLESLQAGHLTSLSRLKIAEGLSEFPREIFELAETLEILDLSDNQLSDLPEDFGQLKHLKIVFLSQNQFTHLPSVLADCPELSMIGFKSNQIETVPEHALPTSTRWLILTDNRIKQLPESMGDLNRLQKLMLAGNQLKSLPDSMANCVNLELLRISANQLTALPKWLLQLPKLSWLAYAGNPFSQDRHNAAVDLPHLKDRDVEIHELLGAGASGHIHRATCTGETAVTQLLPQQIALKLFKGGITSDGFPDDELQASLQSGHHANLVNVLARYQNGHQQGLGMELIPPSYSNLGYPPNFETCTRDTFDETFRLSIDNIVLIAQQVADVVRHLHAHGLTHGDLYTHNLLIAEDSKILLSDFGAASRLCALSSEEKNQAERLETRAFGCVLDDLLVHCHENDHGSHLHQSLEQLRDECFNRKVAERPNLKNISERLETIRLDALLSHEAIAV